MKHLPLLALLLFMSSSLLAQYAQVGYATYYADYLSGQKTAYGEIYQPNQFTAAHKTFPLGTLIKVSRIDDGRSVVVRVNDKGPFKDGYVVDLSGEAGKYIGLDLDGRAKVRVERVGYSENNPVPPNYRPSGDLSAKGFSQPDAYEDNLPISYDQIQAATQSNAPVARLQAGKGGFGIQISSYSIEENATRQAKALQAQGIKNLFILEAEANYSGTTMYKLIVARFADRDAANLQLEYLRRKQGLNGFVTRLP